jgi:4a-hydroxytetrahydrobiopterin dehydratase
MSIQKMSEAEIEAGLKNLPGWVLKKGKLHRELKFKDFVQAFGFMTQAAIIAERMNHHPEWRNVYSQIAVDLTTHEADGISHLDFELAEEMNLILTEMGL